jgi:hypothetical protein
MTFDNSRIRMLFALLAGIAFLVLQAVFPDLPFTEEQTVGFFGLLAAYLIGEGLEGKRIADNLKAMLGSWKFRSLIAGVIVIFLKAFYPDFPITDEQVIQAIELCGALILGIGAQSAMSKF